VALFLTIILDEREVDDRGNVKITAGPFRADWGLMSTHVLVGVEDELQIAATRLVEEITRRWRADRDRKETRKKLRVIPTRTCPGCGVAEGLLHKEGCTYAR
jgi:hypothetical protein